MLTPIEAESASSRVTGRRRRTRMQATGATIALAVLLAGCDPKTTQLATRDPADPAVPVAAVGYRSTIAPYSTLRPAMPSSWRDRNDQVTPRPRSGRQSQ